MYSFVFFFIKKKGFFDEPLMISSKAFSHIYLTPAAVGSGLISPINSHYTIHEERKGLF